MTSGRNAVVGGLLVIALAGCGSGSSADDDLTTHFLRGIAQVREARDYRKLRGQLDRTLASLRRDDASTAAMRRAKALAVRGFQWTRRGNESRIDFVENDSGNLPAATRDAKRADRGLKKGANLLRAAGKILGFRLGRLNGY